MTESVFQKKVSDVSQGAASPIDAPLEPLKQVKQVQGLVWKIAIATLLLMAVGSATRVMNAGLACPDWPLCYGQLVPSRQMNLQVFLEWFHRLDAALIGFSTLILVITSWWQRLYLPQWLPWAATFSLGLILGQGVLGGLTVTELLRFDIVTAHLGTALLFFVTLLAIGTALIPYQGTGVAGKLARLGLTATVLVYLQSLLGGLVGSQWAVHQCFGSGELCAVMNSHLWGVIPAAFATLAVVVAAWQTAGLHPLLRQLSNLAGCLLIGQIALGYATFKLHLQVEALTVAHHTLGASLVGTLVVFTVLAGRDIAHLKSTQGT